MYRAGKAAGKIIRKVIRLWDEMGLRRPIDSHILIGYSTGPDSTALAHLLVRYGRRLLDSQKVRLCYVAHPFRAQEIIQSEILHARMFAKKIGIPISICFMKTFTSLKKKIIRKRSKKRKVHIT